MIPSIDDRLASVIRAMTDLILPSLPAEAGLAIEQAQLSIGQLQIIRAQIDAAPAYEREELDDAHGLGTALLDGGAGGPATKAALAGLRAALATVDPDPAAVRAARVTIHAAIDVLIKAMGVDGEAAYRSAAGQRIVALQAPRTAKDRKWFAPMGFDTDI